MSSYGDYSNHHLKRLSKDQLEKANDVCPEMVKIKVKNKVEEAVRDRVIEEKLKKAADDSLIFYNHHNSDNLDCFKKNCAVIHNPVRPGVNFFKIPGINHKSK